MNRRELYACALGAMAGALTGVAGQAYAGEEEEERKALTRLESTVEVGVGYVDEDNGRFGQFNGLNERGFYGLLGADLVTRDDATGRWLRLRARNLGLDHRELRFEHEVQGNWGYYLSFSQTPRHEPFTARTAVDGIGSGTLTMPAAGSALRDLRLKTGRDTLGLGFRKALAGPWSVSVQFRNEEKDGARLWARGTTGAFEFAPEPIDSTTRQLDALLEYQGKQLQLTAGYYGSMYENSHKGLEFVGGAAGLSSFTPIGLPPDNHSHQVHVSGGYSFSPATRATFKLAYGRMYQNDSFITGVNVPLAPGIGSDLNGRIDTKLVQAGLSARPTSKLNLRANFRYDDRDDKTPIQLYNALAGPTSTFNGENEPRSIRSTTGNLEASYALPMSFRLTGGLDYVEKKRSVSPVRVVSHREKTEETTWRVELRRSMSETVTGALSYRHSARDGSPFLLTTLNNGTAGSNIIAPIHLADRDRDQLRLSVDWQPLEPLSLQFRLDDARDRYDGDRDGSGLGVRKGKARNYAIDASLSFSEEWQGNAWISRDRIDLDQATQTSGGQQWAAALGNVGNSFGLGVRGKASGRLEVGGDLSWSNIKDKYRLQALTGAAIDSLPDVSTRLVRLSLFARYALQKHSGIRVDYVYDRFKSDDWTWTSWTYADGTTLFQEPLQKVQFIGVSYYHKFW